MASVKVFSFALFLVLLFSVDVEGYVLESTSLCCNTHPEFGRCIPNLDTRRCNSWCLKGCDNKKGGFCKRVDKGLELFRDICAGGHSPDVIAYNVMIKALCKARRATKAESLFNEMVSKGLKPSVATYNSMVDGWCKEGEIELAMSCMARMYEDEKDPDVVTYTSLIHGLCASGRPGEAISRWNEMKGRGCCPNVITFMALVQGLQVWLVE
ncbi:hypothetical protein YC2023_013697 [Brassica napus]